MTIKLVKELTTNSFEALRFFNIIFKRWFNFSNTIHATNRCKFVVFFVERCLKRTGLIEFGKDRAYFDFDRLHTIDKCKLNIASGYKASIDIYGEKLLLCTEIAHKLMNTCTVLQRLDQIYQQVGADNFRQAAIGELVGQTVITNYNKKTYRIGDINFDSTPSDTFNRRKGEPITFIDYYQQNYGFRVTDPRQPMLVIHPKERDVRRGQTGPILLIPEFCSLTGIINRFYPLYLII